MLDSFQAICMHQLVKDGLDEDCKLIQPSELNQIPETNIVLKDS